MTRRQSPTPAAEPVVPAPVKQVAGAVQASAQQAVEKAHQVTETTRVAAQRATVPVRAVQRRSRVFLWVALGALAAFAGLAVMIHGHHQNSIDLRVTLAVQRQQRRHALIGHLMRWVSVPGFAPWSWLVPALSAGLLRWLNYRLEARFTLGTTLASLLVAGIKIAIARPRPTHPSVLVTAPLRDYSFPSGHTIHYAAQFGYFAYLAYALLRPGRLRRVALTACSALIGLVGPSRIAMGHHWASDVLASYCLGTSFLITHIALYRRLKARQRPVARGTSMTLPPGEAAG